MYFLQNLGIGLFFYLFGYSLSWYNFYKYQDDISFFVPSVNDPVDMSYYRYFKVRLFSIIFKRQIIFSLEPVANWVRGNDDLYDVEFL